MPSGVKPTKFQARGHAATLAEEHLNIEYNLLLWPTSALGILDNGVL